MLEDIEKKIKKEFPDFKIEKNVDEENKTASISATKDIKKGFDIDIELESKTIKVTFSSKIRMYALGAAVVLTVLLMVLFGTTMLSALGLISDTGMTLKILYIIPCLIFLIPSAILAMTIAGKINPVDVPLLEKVVKSLAEIGLDATIDY